MILIGEYYTKGKKRYGSYGQLMLGMGSNTYEYKLDSKIFHFWSNYTF